MKVLKLLAATTCLSLPVIAQAQPVTGPYVSLGAGVNILTPTNYSTNTTGGIVGPGTAGKVLYRDSYAMDFAGGYGFGPGSGYFGNNAVRVELNFNFYRNTVHKADTDSGYQFISHGGSNMYGPMVNVLYDIDAGWPVFPYLGFGIGYQWQHLVSSFTSGGLGLTGGGVRAGGAKGSFAYNVIAGVAYPLPWVQGLSFTADYRFTRLTEARKYPGSVDYTLQGDFRLKPANEHTILVGLRYQIFQPAPPAPPPTPAPVAAPAPAPAKTYLVFFDWDKYNLTPRATQIIAQAAADSKTQSVTTINVNGYTDTSGTPTYNKGLSVRRAKAVAAQLVVDGVPASEITAQGFGDTNLLVPTGPGVREPQNRRVEIIFH